MRELIHHLTACVDALDVLNDKDVADDDALKVSLLAFKRSVSPQRHLYLQRVAEYLLTSFNLTLVASKTCTLPSTHSVDGPASAAGSRRGRTKLCFRSAKGNY